MNVTQIRSSMLTVYKQEPSFPYAPDGVLMYELYRAACNKVRVCLYVVCKQWRAVAERYAKESFWRLQDAFEAGCDVSIDVLMNGKWPQPGDYVDLEGCMSVATLRRLSCDKLYTANYLHPLCFLRSRGEEFVEELYQTKRYFWGSKRYKVATGTSKIKKMDCPVEVAIALANGHIELALASKSRCLSTAASKVRHLLTEQEIDRLVGEGVFSESVTYPKRHINITGLIEVSNLRRDADEFGLQKPSSKLGPYFSATYVTIPHKIYDHVARMLADEGWRITKQHYGDKYLVCSESVIV